MPIYYWSIRWLTCLVSGSTANNRRIVTVLQHYSRKICIQWNNLFAHRVSLSSIWILVEVESLSIDQRTKRLQNYGQGFNLYQYSNWGGRILVHRSKNEEIAKLWETTKNLNRDILSVEKATVSIDSLIERLNEINISIYGV